MIYVLFAVLALSAGYLMLQGQGLFGLGGAAEGVARVGAREFQQRLESTPGAILVDVRTPGEYQEGHLSKSRLIPLDRLAEQAPGQLPDKNAPLLVYCRSGNRSNTAAHILKRMGYTNITDLSSGIIGWQREGLKITHN